MDSREFRRLLAREPRTFNELLDMFEDYISTVGGPIKKGSDMLREEIGMGDNTALGHIFGVFCDAEDMASRLRQIRAAHGSDDTVTVTIPCASVRIAEHAANALANAIGDAASTMQLVELADRAGHLDERENLIAGLLALCARGLEEIREGEGGQLLDFCRKLRAGLPQPRSEEVA